MRLAISQEVACDSVRVCFDVLRCVDTRDALYGVVLQVQYRIDMLHGVACKQAALLSTAILDQSKDAANLIFLYEYGRSEATRTEMLQALN